MTSEKKSPLLDLGPQFGIVVSLFALIALFTIVYYVREGNFTFFSPENFSNIVGQVMVVGVLAVGMTLVILIGEIDLGVGSVVALTAVVMCLLLQQGWAMPLAIVVTVALGVVVGAWNGFWVARYKIHSFIITLGMLVIGRGLAQIVSGRQNVSPRNEEFTQFFFSTVPPGVSAALIFIAFVAWVAMQFRAESRLRSFGFEPPGESAQTARLAIGFLGFAFAGWVFCGYRGLPLPFLLWLGVVLAGMFILDQTAFGRAIYAVGGNASAAALSGINVGSIKWRVFMISGLLCGVAGILAASREGGATPGNIGRLNELDAIAAVVIGGTSLMGGIGHVRGTILGLFLLAVLANGMSILGTPQDLQEVIKGLIIIAAAWFDVKTKARRA
ncbi:MAG: hypothetical protein FJX76_09720 [Armatimonadetes bacterium]|nr:hypothetical protein [Armatimonadota bacterium]